jgi:hypothetical protein
MRSFYHQIHNIAENRDSISESMTEVETIGGKGHPCQGAHQYGIIGKLF